MSFIDQILLWDTNYQGVVNLSGSKNALHKKIIANHLLGGHIVVRPAELFEGEEFYFNSAVEQGGLLYELLKNGMASLALDQDKTLEDRARWRFNKEVIFDRGVEVNTAKKLDEVKRRTFDRAEKLAQAGWLNAPIQTNTPADIRITNMNERFRMSIWSVARLYLSEQEIVDSPIGSFLQSGVTVASRSDLYPKIDDEWANIVTADKAKVFSAQLKESLTLATTVTTSESFGGKVTDIRNDTLLPFMVSSSHNAKVKGYQTLELEAMDLFVEAMKHELKILERENKPFIAAIRNLDAQRLVQKSIELISSKDRELLVELLYSKSVYLGGDSFVEFLANESLKMSRKDKIVKMRGRIQELEDKHDRSVNVFATVKSAVRATGFEALLLLFGCNANFLVTLGSAVVDTGTHLKKNKTPVFAGFRSSISP